MYLIGGCGDPNIVGDEEYATYLQMGILYLLAVLGPPPEHAKLEVIWAIHHSGPWQCIALKFEEASASETSASLEGYANLAEKVIMHLHFNVNWDKLSRDYVSECLRSEHLS